MKVVEREKKIGRLNFSDAMFGIGMISCVYFTQTVQVNCTVVFSPKNENFLLIKIQNFTMTKCTIKRKEHTKTRAFLHFLY